MTFCFCLFKMRGSAPVRNSAIAFANNSALLPPDKRSIAMPLRPAWTQPSLIEKGRCKIQGVLLTVSFLYSGPNRYLKAMTPAASRWSSPSCHRTIPHPMLLYYTIMTLKGPCDIAHLVRHISHKPYHNLTLKNTVFVGAISGLTVD